jgi:hypothetical protein
MNKFKWQATDGNGETYQYENKPYFIEHCILWIEDSGGKIKYVKDSLLDVPWKESLIEIEQDIVEWVMTEPPTTEEMLIEFEENGDINTMLNYIQMLVDEAYEEGYHECIRRQEEDDK